jgi:hypothetical protein
MSGIFRNGLLPSDVWRPSGDWEQSKNSGAAWKRLDDFVATRFRSAYVLDRVILMRDAARLGQTIRMPDVKFAEVSSNSWIPIVNNLELKQALAHNLNLMDHLLAGKELSTTPRR